MTCKDCYIPKELCNIRVVFETKNDVEKSCSYFKDKSKYIELPCKVGDITIITNEYSEVVIKQKHSDLFKPMLFDYTSRSKVKGVE